MIVCMYVCMYVHVCMYVCMYIHVMLLICYICVSSDDPEKLWRNFRETIIMASRLLPLSPGKENKDWDTDKVVSPWLTWKESPSDPKLQAEYQCLRACAKKTAESARNEWWKVKTEEAKRMYDKSVKQGRGGSLLKKN